MFITIKSCGFDIKSVRMIFSHIPSRGEIKKVFKFQLVKTLNN